MGKSTINGHFQFSVVYCLEPRHFQDIGASPFGSDQALLTLVELHQTMGLCGKFSEIPCTILYLHVHSYFRKKETAIPALIQLNKIPTVHHSRPQPTHKRQPTQNSFRQAELTEAEKFAARAKRWGLPETAPPSATSGAAEDGEKLAARAKRFGATGATGAVVEEDAEKLAARAKRWRNWLGVGDGMLHLWKYGLFLLLTGFFCNIYCVCVCNVVLSWLELIPYVIKSVYCHLV